MTITAIGATLQGAVGFGMGLFAVPLLLLIDPAFVPGPTLFTMALLTLAMSWRDRHGIQVRDLSWAIGGRIAGVLAALAFLVAMPAESVALAFGVLVLLAVGLSASGWHLRPAPATLIGAGALSGFMGTTVSIGGPPMALLYQHEAGPRVRGTLSAYFTIGVVLSLTGLSLVGRFGLAELVRVGVLLPGTLLGFAFSGRLTPRLDRGSLRPAILVLAGIAGLMVIVQHVRALAHDDRALTVVTYNIRHGRGLDGRLDLTRTAAALARLDADVIGLQEVDRGVERSGRVDQADSLGRLLGMEQAFGAFMPYQGGEYGMAILTRLPIERVRRLTLPEGNEPRIALLVVLRLPSGDRVAVINVHFDWVDDDTFRFAQASALAAVLDTLSLAHVVIGDFNDRPGSRTLALFAGLAQAGKPAAARATFPADAPVREIDYLWAGPAPAWTVSAAEVVADRTASDHRPVRAVLRLRSPSAPPAPPPRPSTTP